jgi:hypothetical protein
LFAEIRERGYVGSYASLMRFLAPWRSVRGTGSRNSQPSEAIHPGAVRHVSPGTAVALLSKPKPELDDRQSEMVAILKRRCPGFATMRHLVLSFRSILRGGSVSSLRRWAAKAEASGIEVIVRFVRQLKKDWNAVENAVEQGLEQRSDGRSHQPLEDPQERNVWTCRGRTAAGPPLASGVLTKTAPNLDQNQMIWRPQSRSNYSGPWSVVQRFLGQKHHSHAILVNSENGLLKLLPNYRRLR